MLHDERQLVDWLSFLYFPFAREYLRKKSFSHPAYSSLSGSAHTFEYFGVQHSILTIAKEQLCVARIVITLLAVAIRFTLNTPTTFYIGNRKKELVCLRLPPAEGTCQYQCLQYMHCRHVPLVHI